MMLLMNCVSMVDSHINISNVLGYVYFNVPLCNTHIWPFIAETNKLNDGNHSPLNSVLAANNMYLNIFVLYYVNFQVTLYGRFFCNLYSSFYVHNVL